MSFGGKWGGFSDHLMSGGRRKWSYKKTALLRPKNFFVHKNVSDEQKKGFFQSAIWEKE